MLMVGISPMLYGYQLGVLQLFFEIMPCIPSVCACQIERPASVAPSWNSVSLNPERLCGPQAQEPWALWQGSWMGRCCSPHLLGQVDAFPAVSDGSQLAQLPLCGPFYPLPAVCRGLTPCLGLGFNFLLEGLITGWWSLDLTWGFSDLEFLSPTG